MTGRDVSINDIRRAADMIKEWTVRTPVIKSAKLGELIGCEVYLKPESMQTTGSFKLRGACNKIQSLTAGEKKRGVIAASSGNHAQAVAYMAGKLGIKAVIVMPEDVPAAKAEATKGYGAEVIYHGLTGPERDAKARELVESHGYSLVHSHCDPYVIAGQGTIGLELAETFGQSLSSVIVPCGAGGLSAGVSVAIKGLSKGTRVIGVEPEGIPRYMASRKAGKAVTVEMGETIADGLRVNKAEPLNHRLIDANVDELLTVGDSSIKKAMREIVEKARLTAEPSAVVGIAAAIEGKLDIKKSDRICFVISGGNISKSDLCGYLR